MSGTPVKPKVTFDPNTNTYQLVRFTTPACNNDFPNDPASYEKLANLWLDHRSRARIVVFTSVDEETRQRLDEINRSL